MARKKGHRSFEESHDGGGLFVGENLGVCKARAVVDRDMHALPPPGAAPHPRAVGSSGLGVAFDAGDPLAGATLDASELLDVDMDQLAWPVALVALSGF